MKREEISKIAEEYFPERHGTMSREEYRVLDDKRAAFVKGYELSNAQKQNPWIKVEDALPTNDKQNILMRKRNGKMYCGWYAIKLKKFMTIDPSHTTWTINGVTHWMPVLNIPRVKKQY